MKIHLVSGGCGYVGRNLVKRLYQTTDEVILFIDNLVAGEHPSNWLDVEKTGEIADIAIYGPAERLLFLQVDFRDWLATMLKNPQHLQEKYGLTFEKFSMVFHFAAVIAEQSSVDNATNVAMDTAFFNWVAVHQPENTLYASSSTVYEKQELLENASTIESSIDFKNISAHSPSKLKGEYLARITAKKHNIPITCIRPFSIYGKDQGLKCPIAAIAAKIARYEDPLVIAETAQKGRDFVHIEDVLKGIFVAIKHIKDGSALNLGSGKITSFVEIIPTLCDLADYEPTIQQSFDNTDSSETIYANIDYGKTLGWQPKIPLEEGLADIYLTALERERAAEVV